MHIRNIKSVQNYLRYYLYVDLSTYNFATLCGVLPWKNAPKPPIKAEIIEY